MDESQKPAFFVKSNRSCSATCCSVLEVFFYGVLSGLTIFYLAFFGHINIEVKNSLEKKHTNLDTNNHCIFFAKSKSDHDNQDNQELGSSNTCVFFMGGSGVLIGLFLILVVLSIFNALCGKWSSCLKGCEIFVLLFALLLSFSTNIVMSIGYHISCHEFKGCGDFSQFGYGKTKDNMLIIEPVSWSITGALLVATLVQFTSCIIICCKRKQTYSQYDEDHMYDEKALLTNKQRNFS